MIIFINNTYTFRFLCFVPRRMYFPSIGNDNNIFTPCWEPSSLMDNSLKMLFYGISKNSISSRFLNHPLILRWKLFLHTLYSSLKYMNLCSNMCCVNCVPSSSAWEVIRVGWVYMLPWTTRRSSCFIKFGCLVLGCTQEISIFCKPKRIRMNFRPHYNHRVIIPFILYLKSIQVLQPPVSHEAM